MIVSEQNRERFELWIENTGMKQAKKILKYQDSLVTEDLARISEDILE